MTSESRDKTNPYVIARENGPAAFLAYRLRGESDEQFRARALAADGSKVKRSISALDDIEAFIATAENVSGCEDILQDAGAVQAALADFVARLDSFAADFTFPRGVRGAGRKIRHEFEVGDIVEFDAEQASEWVGPDGKPLFAGRTFKITAKAGREWRLVEENPRGRKPMVIPGVSGSKLAPVGGGTDDNDEE